MTDPLEPNEPVEPLERSAPLPPRQAPPPPPKGPYKPSPLPGILTGLALGAITAGAGYLLGQTLPAKEAAPTAAAPTPAPTPDAKSETAPPAPDAKPDPVAALAARVDDLQKQLAALPKPESAPDTKPLEARVDALAKKVESGPMPDTKAIDDKLAQVSAGVTDAQAKVEALAKSVDAEKGDLAALKDQVKALAEARPAPAAALTNAVAPAPVANANAEADYAKAVDLFKANQFAAARDAFVKLHASMPDDARVWYFSALSNGYATNVWNGDTEKYVLKGHDLEKGGQPDAAKINTAFAGLPAATKAWLDAYRNR